MSRSKRKFQVHAEQQPDGFWSGGFLRRRTSRGTTRHDWRDGFATEDEARAYGQEMLGAFQARRADAKKRQRVNRQARKKVEVWAWDAPFEELVKLVDFQSQDQGVQGHNRIFRRRCELLHADIALQALKQGMCEDHAIDEANRTVGYKTKRWTALARAGDLDRISGRAHAVAAERAKSIAEAGIEALKK